MAPRCYEPSYEPEGGYFVGKHRFSKKDHYCIFCGVYGGPMSSDSGMTPEKALELIRAEESKSSIPPTFQINAQTSLDLYSVAKGFLQGVAYQEEKAKVLVQALLNSRPDSTWADPDYAAFYKRFTIWEKEREAALAHYRQGQKES